MQFIEINNNIIYSAEASAVFSFGGNKDAFATAEKAIEITPAIKVAPWGSNNDLPQQTMAKISVNEIVSSNLLFNIEAAYSFGIKPMVRNPDGTLGECVYREVLDFFEDNDISGFYLEQVSDMMAFFNVFPQIVLSGDRKKIVGLYSLEAAFSRWGSMNPGETQIMRHYYSSLWGSDKKPTIADIEQSAVLSRYNTFADLTEKVARTKDSRFVLQVSMPTPGRTYYADAYWHSIFRSGWYDLSCMIPKNKISILKNNLAVRHIVYISDKYFEGVLKREGIDMSNMAEVNKVRSREIGKISEFINNESGKGSTLMTTKETYASSTGKAIEDKQIDIVPIKAELNGGELVSDSEEASNIISYAMGVHPSLNGATPGKNSGSLGGSDKETLFAMKQSMMRPFQDRLLKPLTLIKKFNGWPQDVVFAVPGMQFNATKSNADK